MSRKLALVVALSTTFLTSSVVAAPCGGFTDVDDTNPAMRWGFCADVAWIKNRGVTSGCPPGGVFTAQSMIQCRACRWRRSCTD